MLVLPVDNVTTFLSPESTMIREMKDRPLNEAHVLPTFSGFL